ncbi:unnamed protein product [Rhizoctonia solani]|uniref:BTB domain-containing protein n=1 Tax=Rhizoctonia solani TaxID=456999 RepID=A0A8H3C609_9AGAM|nr:unnamed protein product [Rhizoctonia solani]
MPSSQVDVLVVGAGPAGLMCALALARAGVHTRIVDKLPERIKHGRADGLHVRTLEILQTYGVAERIIPLGHRLYTSATYNTDNPSGILARVGGKANTMLKRGRYPFGVMVNQAIVESVFRDAMREVGRQHGESAYEYPSSWPARWVEVEQGVAPIWMKREDDFVDVCLRDQAGKLETVRAKYVVGCDGAHSWVRSQLKYVMEGDHSNAVWGVVDTVPTTGFPDIRNHVWINAGQRKCQIIPRENGLVRFYVQLLEADTDGARFDRSKVTVKDIEEIAKQIFKPYKLEFPQRPQWWTVYVVGQRLATKYSASRRVFLVGDACHTHSPHAGQGMNAAIGDSHNLAWKLVHVLRGWAKPQILDTYEHERRQYARELIEFDRKLSRLLASKSEESSRSHRQLLKTFAGFIAGTGISYSATLQQTLDFQSLAPAITIGQRVPPQIILRMADSRPFEIHDILPSDARFKLVVFGGDISRNRQAIVQLGQLLASKSEQSLHNHQRLLKAFAGFIAGTGISYSVTLKQTLAFQNLAPGITIGQLHSSLLSRECEMFRNMFSKPARMASSMSLDGPSEVPKKGKEGSCDENPIVMPQLQPQPFRNFLLAVYGRPSDKEFGSLFKGVAELESVQAITTFLRIIDIVDLAHRFIAPDVETWVLSQLKSHSRVIETLNAYPISSKSHGRLLSYAKRIEDEELILWARHWTRSYYAGAIETSSIASSAFGPAQKIREQLVREYKLATITQSFDTPIFGYLFCFLLSLGHEFWDKQVDLTREDRITLLGAQVRLTPLPQSIPLGWTYLGSTNQPGLRPTLRLCSECHLSRAWRSNFGGAYQAMLRSNAPLGELYHVGLQVPGPILWSATMSAQHEDNWAIHLADLTPTVLPHPAYSQDATYYFRDGNVLLLVEDSLFKVHASVLGRESDTFNRVFDRPNESDLEELVPVDIMGETGFKVLNMRAEHFRHFLFMFYGLPSNQKYRCVMGHDNNVPHDHSQVINFHIYLDVAEIASRFSAPNLKSWAHAELRKIASSAYEELSRFSMRTDYQLRALLYAKRTQDEELAAQVRNAIQLHFAWISVNSPLKLVTTAGALDTSRERLVRVFKQHNLQDIDPALFGFAFCGILGLGHEVWMKDSLLSREDRVMLLSGQVRLMPLPVSTLGLGWMNTLNCQNRKGTGTPIECCSECDHILSWEASFGDNYRQQLCATTPPLCGISQLAILPIQRLVFRGALYENNSLNCTNSCCDRILEFVDLRIQDTYVRLAENFCRNVS